MALTRAQINKMKEAELRTQVLIPLFRAMRYRDVVHYHGGPGEQGKDIVMWKGGDFGQRINYGVVAKAGKISGRAEGKGSASIVTFQIKQSFGSSYCDGVTAEDQRINDCIVVASGAIPKEALDSIKNAVTGTIAERHLTFINGDDLWDLLEKHLPESVVLEKLSSAREVFEKVSPHHRITASINDSGITLSTQPKYAGAEHVDPITFKVKLAYPNTPEGIAARDEFANHISTGAPVTVPRSFVAGLEVPEFLRPFINTDELTHFALGPSQSPNIVAASLIITGAQTEPIRLDNLEFRTIQAGQDEITIANSHQLSQWHFEIRLNQKARLANVTFELKAEHHNVKRELERTRLWEALCSGCEFTLVSRDTGKKLFDGRLPAHPEEGPPPGLVNFLEKLLLIQTRTGTPIAVPPRDFSREEVETVHDLAARLEHGSTKRPFESASVTVNREGAQNIVAGKFKQAGEALTVSQLEVWTILEAEVPVGRSVSVLRGITLASGTVEELQGSLRDEPDSDSFNVQFRPVDEAAEVEVLYPDSTGGADEEDIQKLSVLSHLGASTEELQQIARSRELQQAARS